MSVRHSILILDDELMVVDTLERMLSPLYRVHGCTDVAPARKILSEEQVDLMLLDYKLKETDGMMVLQEVKELYPEMEVIMITGYGEIETAVRALKAGAYHFLAKPFESNVLKNLIKNALDKKEFADLAKNLRRQVENKYHLDKLIGSSATIKNLKELIKKAREVDTDLLLIGEGGTGKEFVSRIIHTGSQRMEGPFVTFNCGAVAESEMETALFGQGRQGKDGALSAAENGTLFLDEITDIPVALQATINDVVATGEYTPVGTDKKVKSFARIMAATSRKEAELQNEKLCNRNLAVRLKLFPILIPPLRDREGDIRELAEFFLCESSRKSNRKFQGFSDMALEKLIAYPWPGNIRQLENVIDRVAILEDSDVITDTSLPPEISEIVLTATATDTNTTYRQYIKMCNDQASRQYLRALLEKTDGSVTKAASLSGMKRESFHRLLKKHGLSSKSIARK